MSEQKQTPGPWKEWENTKSTADDKQRIQQKASELYDEFREWAEWEACQNGAEYEHMYQRQQVNKKVAELTKENEAMKNMLHGYIGREKALTEQVEGLNKVIDVQTRMLASKQFETPELDRLREERKELVEALKARIEWVKHSKADAERYNDWFKPEVMALQEIDALESLLSKFEPNQS